MKMPMSVAKGSCRILLRPNQVLLPYWVVGIMGSRYVCVLY
jgi:hypothetical protein